MPSMTIHAQLLDAHEPIERVMEIPEKATTFGLHRVLQAAFSWRDAHQHQFSTLAGHPVAGHESDLSLRELFPTVGTQVKYTYDFGDDWTILLTMTAHGGRKRKYAKLASGKGASPYDDAGGVSGWKNISGVAHRMLEETEPELSSYEEDIRRTLLAKGPARKVCRWVTQFNQEACARAVAKVDIFADLPASVVAARSRTRHGGALAALPANRSVSSELIKSLRAKNATALECLAAIMDIPEFTEMTAMIATAQPQELDRYELAEFVTPMFDFFGYVDDEMQGVDCREHVLTHVEDLAELFELDPFDPRIHITLNEVFIAFMKMDLLEIVDETTVELTKQGLRFLANQQDLKLMEFLTARCPVAEGRAILVPLVDILILLMPGTIARLALEAGVEELEFRSRLMARAVSLAFPDSDDPDGDMERALAVHNTMLNITSMMMENPLDPEGPPIILSGAQKFFINSLLGMDPERILGCEWH